MSDGRRLVPSSASAALLRRPDVTLNIAIRRCASQNVLPRGLPKGTP
jgi:hypothetical protein